MDLLRKSYGDFWEVNSDAIEWRIEEREIFVELPATILSN